MIRDRSNYKYFYGMIISAILPLSAIVINPQPLIAQETRVENAIIYVDSQTGNDNSDGGTRNTPLKTITQALKIAEPNTVISLAPGNYNEATGETFPLIIKSNVTLEGVPGGQGQSVVIEGGGAFISHSAAEQSVTIAAIEDAGVITGVTVTNPNSRGHGLWIESANPAVSNNSFIRNNNTGLSVNGNSKPIITNNYFNSNGGNGLLVYGTSSPQIIDNSFDTTGFGVSIVQNAAPILENNTFEGNRIGIILEGDSQGILRNNTITNSLEYGLVAIAQSKVDLGTPTQSGNNVFRSNKKLDIQNITTNTISATGTEINGYTEGKIDFSNNAVSAISEDTVASNPTTAISRLRKNPLPDAKSDRTTAVTQPQTASNPPITEPETLPPPPQVKTPQVSTPQVNDSAATESAAKEYVFSAPVANEDNTITEESANNTLPVPNATPPSSLGNNADSANVNSLSDLLATSPSSAIQYRVLVEATNDNQQAKVKSLYPDAFTIKYQGKSMLQVGAYSERTKAETTSRSLADLGLNSHILE